MSGKVVGRSRMELETGTGVTPGPDPGRQRMTREALLAALAERDRELAEAREQQAAIAEVLQAINASSDDLAAAFDSILEKAVRFCDATGGGLWLAEGDMARVVGGSSTLPRPFLDYVFRAPFPVTDILGRSGHVRPFVHIDDLRATRAYQERAPYVVACVELGEMRTALLAPLHGDGAVVGIFTLVRDHVRPFTERQIALVQAFAAQALIVIKNARLFNETQEALEQQKASAEVLGAISKSAADTAPVFEAIIDACQRLFGSEEIGIYTIGDDDMVRVAAWRGPRAEEVRRDVTPVGESVTGRIVRERRTHHIPNIAAEPNLSPTLRERAERLGSASLLYAPMLREDRGLGSILVVRSPPKPFAEREHALLQSFADQAAIAIQNARMFRETNEALRQQTATSDILRAIASSPGDVAPVLERLTETTCRLCDSNDAVVLLREGDNLRAAAHSGPIPLPALRTRPIGRGWPPGRAVCDRRTVHVHDLAAAQDEYPAGVSFQAGAGRGHVAKRPARHSMEDHSRGASDARVARLLGRSCSGAPKSRHSPKPRSRSSRPSPIRQ